MATKRKKLDAPAITYTIRLDEKDVVFHGWFAGVAADNYPDWCNKVWTFVQVANGYDPPFAMVPRTFKARCEAMKIARDELIDLGLIQE